MIIVAFDGNVYTGKTNIIKKLAMECGFPTIKEYGEYFSNRLTEEELNLSNCLEAQHRYLAIDKLRLASVHPKKINLLDRSYISLCAHVSALYKVYRIDIRKEFLDLLQQFINRQEIILPDAFVHVECEWGCAKKRMNENKRAPDNKNTPCLYINSKYFYAIDNFNQEWATMIKPWSMVINTAAWQNVSFTELVCFIKKINQLKARKISLFIRQQNVVGVIKNTLSF